MEMKTGWRGGGGGDAVCAFPPKPIFPYPVSGCSCRSKKKREKQSKIGKKRKPKQGPEKLQPSPSEGASFVYPAVLRARILLLCFVYFPVNAKLSPE